MCASLFTWVEHRWLRKGEAAIFPPQPGKKLTETTVVDVVGLSHLIKRRGDKISFFFFLNTSILPNLCAVQYDEDYEYCS